MTTRLDKLNAADELPEEAAPQPEKAYSKPIEPVFPQPAESNPSKLQAAIAAAVAKKQALHERTQAERERLDEALSNSEPARDELQTTADALLNTSVKGVETRELAKILQDEISRRQELIRNLRETAGVVLPEIENYGVNVEDKLAAVIGANCAMREIIREICAAAGTVRIDEIVPLKTDSGKVILKRTFVDIGDEEPGQDPIVDLKWLLPAGIKVAARFRALMSEHANATKAAAEAQYSLTLIQARLRQMEADRRADQAAIKALEDAASDHRPAMPGNPSGYFIRAENGKWLGKYDGKHACFLTKWRTVDDQKDAHAFEFKEDAHETLGRLQFARVQRIARSVRETFRVITIRYEDHS